MFMSAVRNPGEPFFPMSDSHLHHFSQAFDSSDVFNYFNTASTKNFKDVDEKLKAKFPDVTDRTNYLLDMWKKKLDCKMNNLDFFKDLG